MIDIEFDTVTRVRLNGKTIGSIALHGATYHFMAFPTAGVSPFVREVTDAIDAKVAELNRPKYLGD